MIHGSIADIRLLVERMAAALPAVVEDDIEQARRTR